ncbi:hypothetical protein GCM10010116_50820 [Microbispora rosea subsp. aerata]|nr:hypothetical protein [Microbispora rosea]GGO25320.1 hypothetical protein GCM10010116_50820 [Microbispora rosea subsp. aerata]GIH58135.1 hypothetical protein Mro02_50490 [Microbispora rosea subsp. aerata]GLJ85263.1 hypothetical protein GCM10017588_39920 [Microbispora rosea subsp. aerata]
MLRYVLTFLPWIAFAVLSTNGEARYGAVTALLVSVVLLAADRRAGRGWDEMVIELSSGVFFAGLTLAAFTVSPAPFGAYGPAVSVAWLALTAWGSLAVRRPFTLGIARRTTPAEVHATPMFYRVNAVITAVWAAGFTLNAAGLALLLAFAPHATAAIVAVKVCGFALPALFTIRYPQIVRARYAA